MKNTQNNAQNLNGGKVGGYTEKNSALMFLLALFLPYVLYFLFVLLVNIFVYNTKVYNEILFGVTGNYISLIICQLSLIGAVYVLTKKNKLNFVKANNVSFKLDIVKILLVIAIGLVALFGFNWLSDMLSHVLSLLGYKISSSSMQSYGVNNFGMLLVCLLFLAIFPAVCEEFSMRGVVFNGLLKKSKNFAIFISALMFMIIHLSLEQSIYQFVLGVVLASIVYYSGNIIYSIILHLVNNSLVIILNYVSSVSITPQKFTSFLDYFLPILTALITTVVIYFLFKLFKLRCKQTNCITLNEKLLKEKNNYLNSSEHSLKINEATKLNQEKSNEQVARDLPKPKVEILDSKTAVIISLAIGIITWIISVASRFVM